MDKVGPFVFVSVADKDQERVAPLLDILQKSGIPLRRFADLVSLGASYRDELPAILSEAVAVLLVWSAASNRSDSVAGEADLAARAGKLVPVTVDGWAAIPEAFTDYHAVDLSGWTGDPDDPGIQQLLRVLEKRLEAPPEPDGLGTADRPSSASPIIGLFAFDQLDPSAVEVLRYADGLRRALGLDKIHMEHLIEALYQDGTARTALANAGIDHEALLDLIEEVAHTRLPANARPSRLTAMPPLSRHVGDAVSNALAEVGDTASRVDSWALFNGALEVTGCSLIRALLDRRREAQGDAADGSAATEPPVPAAPADDKREHVRWVSDDPVGAQEDRLGRRGVARALDSQLRELVERVPGRSFLVHVDGSWGAGKSTLLRFLSDLVREPEEPLTADDRWLSVDYDAWRQAKVGPPWLTLLQTIRSAVRAGQGSWSRRAWFSLRERARLISAWQWTALAVMTVLAVLIVVLVLTTADRGISVTQWGDVVKLLGGLVPLVAAGWLVAGLTGRFLSLDSRRSARAFLENRADPMEDLATHFQWVLRQAGRPVLLLVDDLDRCPETFVVDLLDAVQKLMREPHPLRTGSWDGTGTDIRQTCPLVVVVAADGRWIRQAYDNAFASLDKAVREPGATIGSLFLEKLFQLTLPVPRMPDQLKHQFLVDLLAADGRRPAEAPSPTALRDEVAAAPRDQVLEVLARVTPAERLEVADVAIDRLVVERGARPETAHALEPFSPLLDPTPRAMKRFVMAYSVLRAVRTAEGSVIGLGPLALWTVVVTRWPLLAEYLQDDPAAVRFFAVPPEQLGAVVPAELTRLFENPPDDLRAVMNHEAGPLDADTIRECCGQVVRP